MDRCPRMGRCGLAEELARLWQWRSANGRLKARSALAVLGVLVPTLQVLALTRPIFDAVYEFMRRALAGTIALAFGAGPIGVFLMLRRMSLVGDAMAHAILPGAAVGFLLAGLNLFAMTAGGLIAGCVVALLTGVVARLTELKEDASLATFYLVSLALGVTIVSVKGTNIDLLHVLFGNILAMDDQTLLVIAFNATITRERSYAARTISLHSRTASSSSAAFSLSHAANSA
mgnify:CR=1 FL=1